MPGLYDKQLLAISEMLKATSKGLKMEGYDLLFRLWRENADSDEFIQDLLPIALEHDKLVSELRSRLNELSLKDTITNTFLKDHLEIFDSKVQNSRRAQQEEEKQAKAIPQEVIGAENQKTKHSRWQIALVVSILIIVIVVSGINLLYVLPRNDGTLSTDLVGLKLNYNSPTYLSVNDENMIEISVENSGQKEFEGRITLDFDDPDSLIRATGNQGMSEEIDLHSQDQKPIQFKFLLIKKPAHKRLAYRFQFTSSDGSQHMTNDVEFWIAPLPYLRSASNWLFGTLGALIVTSLWDQIKKIGEGAIGKMVEQVRGTFLAR